MSEILRWSATETARHLRAGDVSAVEVCTAHLERRDAINPALNAVVEDVPEALEVAREIDQGRRPRGLLAGAPITTKINADMAGYANSNGLKGLAGNICPEDSAVVANLKAAGGVIIGRTNTPEMSLRWCTSNPLYGITKNPWDSMLTPGGSSGGAAAAVSSGIGVIAHGNDLGGSVRYPAFACGICGLRPSRGRIPAYNPSAPIDRPEMTMALSVQGPLARSVADVQLGLDAMRGYHPGDGNWVGANASGRTRREGPLRIGLAPDGFGASTDPELKKAVRLAGDAAQSAGMEVRSVRPPELERCAEIWGQLLFTETQVLYEDLIRSETSQELQRWIEAFTQMFECQDLAGYIKAMTERARLQREWALMWDEIDFLITPTSLIPPFENDLDFKDPSKSAEIIAAQAPLYVINLLGLPALSLPTHVANGAPLGVQLVGPMHDDDKVLATGALIESELGRVIDLVPAPFCLVQS